MTPALVKIDVAAALLRLSAKAVFELAEGSPKVHRRPLLFIFDLAANPTRSRRDLRFWLPEVEAHAAGDPGRYAEWALAAIIDRILPVRRAHFHAGEIDQLFQVRHNHRAELNGQLGGILQAGCRRYPRTALVEFLQRRWLSAAVAAPHAFGMPPSIKRDTPQGVLPRAAAGFGHSRRSPGSAGARRSISQFAEVEPGVGGGKKIESPGFPGDSPPPPSSHARTRP